MLPNRRALEMCYLAAGMAVIDSLATQSFEEGMATCRPPAR